MVLEGIRGSGIEGDIAIDDVTIEEGECRDPPPSSSEYIGQAFYKQWFLSLLKTRINHKG
ncbi:hypothetical protein M9458_034727, partial [Cirrhinus mrigala]